MKLPVIELKINELEDSYVSAISIVNSPATESDFLSFSQVQNFAVNDEKFELLGYAMQADKPIFRTSPSGNYYAVFSKDTIRKIAQVFAQKGLFNQTNIEHSAIPADSFVFQSYLVDVDKGINAPKGLPNLDGGWIVGVKVCNPEIWQEIKKGNIKGFSVEGVFGLFPTNQLSDGKSDIEDLDLQKAIKEFNAALEKVNKIKG
ncbi:XkdF-like putative serine protease domain-containing protein [Mucilaginibacter ginsenosidivorax]|uniref:Phage-like element PBSX protein XkdF domain-containing protein n=1 Tax=Mucilaginibacter ginsenosidivorax TaxID=862126 RepID=A0A5B8W943_9SPHI|nr:XkdF-like putative serine protease domain-containing protein [Mucilaginibacter ginsenosidivorax]QEC78768.1 hypothetical protein FSB76_23490 [Mucilaginibacter ginsenosidivorax]